MECKIDGCVKKVHAMGLCKSHDRRLKLYGDPLAVRQLQYHGLTTAERFLQRVEKTDGCWLWTGSIKNKTGHGQFRMDDKPMVASRAAWIIFRGEITKDKSTYGTMFVCHTCDNPQCVNPAHLFLGTNQDNVTDKMEKGRHRYGISLGESHGNSKLDEAKVRYIRESGLGSTELARQFNLSQATVWAVLHKRTWKHVV